MDKEASAAKTKPRCDVCGKRFKKGGTRYRINLEIISDFDGHIEDISNKPKDHLKKRIEEILEETAEMTEEELEEEMYLKRNWLVCVGCRERFLHALKRLSQ